jgi:hypothetical protein
VPPALMVVTPALVALPKSCRVPPNRTVVFEAVPPDDTTSTPVLEMVELLVVPADATVMTPPLPTPKLLST